MNKRSQRIPPSNTLEGNQLSLLGEKESFFDWEIDSGPTCNHIWQKSLNSFGFPQWKCFSCRETKPSDPDEDREWWEASMLQLQLQGNEYYKRAMESRTKADRDKYLECMTACRVRHARMACLMDKPSEQAYYEEKIKALKASERQPLATQELPGDMMGDTETLDDSNPSPNPVSDAQGMDNPIRGVLTQISPSNKSRRKNGEGTGSIFTTQVTRRSKSYTQHWFQYEDRLPNGKRKRKSVYIPVNKVARIKQLQLDREPVEVILEALGHKKE